jgi:hypothetical protein
MWKFSSSTSFPAIFSATSSGSVPFVPSVVFGLSPTAWPPAMTAWVSQSELSASQSAVWDASTVSPARFSVGSASR